MSKKVLIIGVISVMVVVAGAVGGAMLAVSTTTSVEYENNKAKDETNKLNDETLQKAKTNTGEWKQEDNGWYYYVNSEKQKDWILDKNRWFYLGADGKMKTEWVQDKNKWYYLGSDGKMRNGWLNYNGNWYYLNEDGIMQVKTTIGEVYLNEKGVISKIPNQK